MTTDEKISLLNGKIDGLMYVCSSLLFFHPDANTIEQIIIGLHTNANATETSNAYEQMYMDGVKEVTEALEKQMASQKWFEKKVRDLGENIQ